MGSRIKYSKYQVEDLLADESFQNWVLHQPESPTPTDQFWNKLSKEATPLADHIRLAKSLILALGFREEFPSEVKIKAALNKHQTQIAVVEQAAETATVTAVTPAANLRLKHPRLRLLPKKHNLSRLTLRAAACIGLLLGLYFTFQYTQSKATITIKTAYGQTKTLVLPDSSTVILNAHSTLTYPKHWQKNKTRELTLIGEAYFKVRHLNQDTTNIRPSDRFIVHSGQMEVEVLGTRFDVKQKGSVTSVLLEQGRVKLTLKPLGLKFNLQPGERIVYDDSSNQYNRTHVNPTDYISWTNHEILLKDKSLQEISQLLSDYYGLQVKLQGPALAQMKMEGTLLLDSLPDVLFALSTAMHLEIERHNDTLIFRNQRQ